jgi:hypothetical protein
MYYKAGGFVNHKDGIATTPFSSLHGTAGYKLPCAAFFAMVPGSSSKREIHSSETAGCHHADIPALPD